MSWSNVKGVTIHHTVTSAPTDHDRCVALATGITNHHKSKGYHDDAGNLAIAYNYLLCPHGRVVAGRGLASSNDANGCTQANREWVAIAILGTDPGMNDAVERQVRFIIADVEERFGIAAAVIGHREVDCADTTCPGPKLQRWCDTYTKEDVLTDAQMQELKGYIDTRVRTICQTIVGALTVGANSPDNNYLPDNDAWKARLANNLARAIQTGSSGVDPVAVKESVKAAIREGTA